MIIDEQFLRDNPTYSFGGLLEDAAQDYVAAFEAVWGLDSHAPPDGMDFDDWQPLVQLYRLAQKFATGASTLIRPKKIREELIGLPDLLREEAEHHDKTIGEILEKAKGAYPEEFYWQLFWILHADSPTDPRTKRRFFEICMELEAHRLYNTPVITLAERMLHLVGLMVREPGEFTRAYLSRVAECYVRNMKPELAVMARAVLDVAIQDLITDDEVRVEVGVAPKGDVVLERRITACRSKEWFNPQQERLATKIREWGRTAAHFTPGLEEDADAIVEALALVLRRLQKVKAERSNG